MGRIIRHILLLMISAFVCVQMHAQTESDERVHLIKADVARNVEINEKTYRKVVGNAVFLHNDTYLMCDSAYWNVTDNFIDALGRVVIEQDKTTLTGDSLKYLVKNNLAQFRGHLVELKDGDGNVLRTNNLDYDTKDSVGVFFGGAAMMDEDGNIIESEYGRYESKKELFTFIRNVEMFSDSLFFVCDTLEYETDRNFATFKQNIGGWYRENALSAGAGWYDRENENLFFRKNVHGLTDEQEVWCDSLNYDRYTEFTRMRGNVQITDTVNNSIILAGDLRFWNEPRRSELYRDPAIILLQETEEAVDSIFLAADRLYYHTERMCDVDSMLVVVSKKRYEQAQVDPVATKRAEAAKKASNKGGKDAGRSGPGGRPNQQGGRQGQPGGRPGQQGGRPAQQGGRTNQAPPKTKGRQLSYQTDSVSILPADTVALADTVVLADTLMSLDTMALADTAVLSDTTALSDTLAIKDTVSVNDTLMLSDSLMMGDTVALKDSIAPPPPPDTTEVSFVRAVGNVRAFMEGMQMRSDSLDFNSIDSLVRLYRKPMLWHEITTQITADSIQFLLKDQTIKKGFLYSNSFVAAEEEGGKFFHQIKSPEMIGYFEGNELTRFDALGGVNALMFLTEDSLVTTMNQKDCRIMSGYLKDGSIQRVISFESAKSDAHPIWSVTPERAKLKGFLWEPEKRPVSGRDVTSRKIRHSQREGAAPDKDFPVFRYTTNYFKGYMERIFREIDAKGGIIWKEE